MGTHYCSYPGQVNLCIIIVLNTWCHFWNPIAMINLKMRNITVWRMHICASNVSRTLGWTFQVMEHKRNCAQCAWTIIAHGQIHASMHVGSQASQTSPGHCTLRVLVTDYALKHEYWHDIKSRDSDWPRTIMEMESAPGPGATGTQPPWVLGHDWDWKLLLQQAPYGSCVLELLHTESTWISGEKWFPSFQGGRCNA